MLLTSEQLTERILDFMVVISECCSATNFANDRSVYAHDLAAAMRWIVDLRSGADVGGVVREILSPKTDKAFGDYYRQGVWGDQEAEGLKRLKNSIEQ